MNNSVPSEHGTCMVGGICSMLAVAQGIGYVMKHMPNKCFWQDETFLKGTKISKKLSKMGQENCYLCLSYHSRSVRKSPNSAYSKQVRNLEPMRPFFGTNDAGMDTHSRTLTTFWQPLSFSCRIRWPS